MIYNIDKSLILEGVDWKKLKGNAETRKSKTQNKFSDANMTSKWLKTNSPKKDESKTEKIGWEPFKGRNHTRNLTTNKIADYDTRESLENRRTKHTRES